jgi:DNA-binding response OmpR family regulator
VQILVVEDEPRIGSLIRRGLREEGFAVVVLPDAESALEGFTPGKYDLMIFDVMLPGMDGLTLCGEIRSRNTNVPILLLTARGSVRDRVAGLNSGADDYLTKPFAFDELVARVRALLRRSPQALPVTLTAGDLTLDTATREVVRAGQRVSLTATEFGLLEYLLRNKGIPLSRTQILDHVWNYDYAGVSNIVDTYVRYLRRKLHVQSQCDELIETVRGHGYVVRDRDAS